MTLTEREFEQLYREAAPRVLAFLRRRVPNADAEDLLGETFLVVWRRQDALPVGDARLAWVFGVARRMCLAHHRSTAALPTVRPPGDLGRLADDLMQGSRTVGSGQRADEVAVRVGRALASLAPMDQELITLTVWDRLTPAQAALVVGLSGGAARVRVHRARRRLATELRDLEGESADPERVLKGHRELGYHRPPGVPVDPPLAAD